MHRCSSCGNLQDVIAVDGAITIFFRCEKCEAKTFLENKLEQFLTTALIIDNT